MHDSAAHADFHPGQILRSAAPLHVVPSYRLRLDEINSGGGIIRLVGIDRNVPPPLELIRQKKSFYLGDQEPTGRFLAVNLAECALVSGADRVELVSLADGWMAVSADSDWITPNLVGRRNSSFERAFVAMIPLRGGKQNQIRFEIFITAFSSRVSVKTGPDWKSIAGELPPQEVRDCVEKNEFAVVFRAACEAP
jgi:hypothetical protein